MCDPVSMAVGAVVGAAGSGMFGGKQRSAALPDPAAERAAAEAEATTAANRKLAATQARRREQGSLIARGAPQPTFGDVETGDVQKATGGLFQTTLASKFNLKNGGTLISRGSAPADPAPGGMNQAMRSAFGSKLARRDY